jgi:hypothetical protein
MLRSTSQDAVAIVERRLRRQRYFTLTEAAALTGLSIDETREALEALLTKYVCRLQVSEHGDLIYNFGPSLRRRGAKTFAEHMQELGAWLWKGFTVVYKAWITVTLVVYFVLFLVLMIVLLIASSSRQSSDRRRTASFDLEPLLYMFWGIFRWRTVTGSIGYDRDRYGYSYRRYEPEPGVLNPQKKSLIAAVYDFVFGPPRATIDPLQNEKEVAAYLRQQKGVIVTSELIALAGWTFPQAETFLTDCVIRYQGDTEVSENAVLYGQFDTITRSVGAGEAGEIVYYWDEYEPEYELTGNDTGHNLLIGVMNSFNLLVATLVVAGSFSQLLPTADGTSFTTTVNSMASGTWFTVFLGWIPLVFSGLFFAIPLGRWLSIRTLRQRRHVHNMRRRLFKAIFARQGQAQPLPDVLAAVNTNPREETLPRQVVQDMMQELALDLEGDMTVDDAAELRFAFPRIRRELREVEQLRRHRRLDETLGKIIVESDNIVEPENERLRHERNT